MNSNDNPSKRATDPGKRAKKIVREKAARSPENFESLSLEELRKRLQELQARQIELEIQNEELRQGSGDQERLLAALTEELRESQRKLNVITDGVPAVVNVVRAQDLRYRFVNRFYAAMFGIYPDDLIGKHVGEVMGVESYARARPYIDRALAGERVSYDNMVPARGEPRWFNVRYEPEFDGQGAVQNLIVIAVDITDRKRMEQALRFSEASFRALAENSGDYIMRYDREHRHVYANPRAIAVSGKTTEDFIGKTHREMGFPEHLCALWEIGINKVFSTGHPHAEIFEWQSAEGTVILDWRLFPETNPQGEVKFVLGVSRDITAIKRAEEQREKLQEQLNQAQKMESIGRLAGGVAHDFNNMLGVILGHAEMAMDQMNPSQLPYANLEEIRKTANRSADLTRQLLAFARQQTVSPKVLDLNETMEGMLKMLRRLIGEELSLKWQPGRGLWPVRMDPSQIDQILTNLCVNARDAISGVGKVTIEMGNVTFDEAFCASHPDSYPGDYVRLVVGDDGCGMNKETLGRIFEPFFTTKGIGEGTGLGLATVYGVVRQNHGFIYVDSEPGKGTTFSIYLPRHVGKTEKNCSENLAGVDQVGQETILLVEDEPALLELITMLLENLGYQVLAARSPTEAMQLARAHAGKIHLLLTDVVMPEMNGWDLATNLQVLLPNLKRLFMSGYPAHVIAQQGVLDDRVFFIQKPFSKKDLGSKIREVLERESFRNPDR